MKCLFTRIAQNVVKPLEVLEQPYHAQSLLLTASPFGLAV